MASPTTTSILTKIPPVGKVGVGVALSALVFFGYWFVFYSDVASKIEGATRQQKALVDGLAQERLAEASYFADRGELTLREQHAREMNKALPPNAEEDAFLSSVQLASNAAGIDLQAYSPTDEVAQSFYSKIPMHLELTGKFHQIAKFAYELGKIERIINVENIESSATRSSCMPGVWRRPSTRSLRGSRRPRRLGGQDDERTERKTSAPYGGSLRLARGGGDGLRWFECLRRPRDYHSTATPGPCAADGGGDGLGPAAGVEGARLHRERLRRKRPQS
jgi:type IV pilus assembly protein PilO